MTKTHEECSEVIMQKVEGVLGIKKSADDFRKGHLSKIAAFKIDNPKREMKMIEVFGEYYRSIKRYYYAQKQSVITDVYSQLLNPNQNKKHKSKIEPDVIYKNMEDKFQYTKYMVDENLKFVLKHKNIKI